MTSWQCSKALNPIVKVNSNCRDDNSYKNKKLDLFPSKNNFFSNIFKEFPDAETADDYEDSYRNEIKKGENKKPRHILH